MFRQHVIRTLRWLNGHTKNALGMNDEVRTSGVAGVMLDMMQLEDESPLYDSQCRADHFVFVLQHVTRGSGGLADILQLGMAMAQSDALQVRFLIPSGLDWETAWNDMQWTCPELEKGQVLGVLDYIPEFLCATAWPTAYKVLTMPSKRKLYFVQDFEPWFHAAGLERCYAEKSYRLGLEIFTLGPWLKKHLEAQYAGISAFALPFPITCPIHGGLPWEKRNKLTFYVQPEKAHRGSELLIEAASRLSREGDVEQHGLELTLFGSTELSYTDFAFPCRRYDVLNHRELLELYRTSRIGICASFTNVSLVTFCYLASGCVALDLDLPNVTSNIPNTLHNVAGFYQPKPSALVDAIRQAMNESPAKSDIHSTAGVLKNHTWHACAALLCNKMLCVGSK